LKKIMSVTTKPITAEELFAMGDIGRCELVKGEIIHMPPAGAEHGDLAAELLYHIKAFVNRGKLGKVYAAETGFTIARNPDTTRAPDVAFVRTERVPAGYRRGFFDGPPDLAVEVLSPDDRASDVLSKIDEWLSAGATSVWIADPQTRSIEIYRQGRQVVRYARDDCLRDEPTLPGFELKLSEVFEL
jgi:Uma2 family endonuclease